MKKATLIAPLALLALAFTTPALADDGTAWQADGGYVGLSGGFAFGGESSDSGSFDFGDRRFTDEVSVDTGWQGTLEGGVVRHLGNLDWLRLRLGGEVGYGQFDLDAYTDPFSGDAVAGDGRLLRVGPAAAVDFRIPQTPFSFTAGVGAGAGFLNLDATVTNGTTRDAGKDTTTLYVSGLISANYALTPQVDLTLGVRSIWLANARINGTNTPSGSTSYAVRHEIGPISAVELGLRWKF